MTWLIGAGVSWAVLAVLAGVLIGRTVRVADGRHPLRARRSHTGPDPGPAAAPPDVTAPRAVR